MAERTHAQMRTRILVFCKDHGVDEPHYEEYLDHEDTARAWIALHDLQHHRPRRG